MQRAVREGGLPFDVSDVPADELAVVLEQHAASGVRRVAIAGGDGTIALAAGIAARLSLELAIIPAGTLNHLATDLRIPSDLDEALRIATSGRTRSIDAASVNGHFFLNTSSVGTYVTFVRLRERLERYLGYHLASFVAAFRLWIRPRVFTVEVEIGGTPRAEMTPLIFAGVGERELKLPTLGGRARDGKRGLHLMIVRGRTPARIAALAFAAAARGTRSAARGPALDAFLVDRFTIRLPRPRGRVATDGELHTMTAPLEYVWIADAVRVVTPR
ncbi:MAG TPA: diacylglycerol kinase family protein [Gemmatimonadaceae bacterium]|nr:diacylglycerol kinase family protein [Gemmatimonadaceae bacterium]